jgi:1,4-alpha-glucan branching enzyme
MVDHQNLSSDLTKIIEARHHDPFSILGPHTSNKQTTVRVFLPHTQSASIDGLHPLARVEGTDFFEWQGDASQLRIPY